MNRTIKATGIFLVCWLFPLKVNAGTLDFSQLIVLGDSLSDTGNVFSATDRVVPPEMLGGSLAYFDGRFTNGANWIDNLAEDFLGLSATPTPIEDVLNGAISQGGLNLAFGGATTEAANTVDPKLLALQDVSDSQPGQISLLNNFTSLVDSQALYILWFGANDYLPTTSPDFVPFDTPEFTVNNIANALTKLVELGATDILVPNLPLLGSVPRVNNLDPFFPVETDTAEKLNLLTIEHNQSLSSTLEDLSIKFGKEVNLIPLEIDLLFNQIIAEFNNTPEQSPFTNVTDICLLNPDCINPDQFLFWDGIHPTRKTHKLIAEFAFKTLLQETSQPIPESSLNWQVLILASFLFLSARIKFPIGK